jgi:hypothetical protein
MRTRARSVVRYESSMTIDSSIEEVFARLTDLGDYATWMH